MPQLNITPQSLTDLQNTLVGVGAITATVMPVYGPEINLALLLTGALNNVVLPELLPKLQQLLNGGKITAEDQMSVLKQITDLRDNLNGLDFTGPEWNQSGQ